MSEYTEKNRRQDTKDFLVSQLGKEIMESISETAEGYLSIARNNTEPSPVRLANLDKYSAIKEITELINQPLDA